MAWDCGCQELSAEKFLGAANRSPFLGLSLEGAKWVVNVAVQTSLVRLLLSVDRAGLSFLGESRTGTCDWPRESIRLGSWFLFAPRFWYPVMSPMA